MSEQTLSTETSLPEIQTDEIAARARDLWQKAGSPDGRDLEFWLAAEQELQLNRRQTADTAKKGTTKSGTIAKSSVPTKSADSSAGPSKARAKKKV